jgi:hypothetical protein
VSDESSSATTKGVHPARRESQSATLPDAHAVPCLDLDAGNIARLALPADVRVIIAAIDGRRTVAEVARASGRSIRETQLVVADLRDQRILTTID